MISIIFPDSSVKKFEKGTKVIDVAKSISEGLARKVISASFNKETCELETKLDVDGNIKFYHPNDLKNENFSATNFFHSKTYVTLPCKSIVTLMKEYEQSKIDVLKMDIEGASFDILNDLLDNNVHPKQIVVELERPFFIYNASFFELFSYLNKRRKLHSRLKRVGYDLVELQANELLAIKLY